MPTARELLDQADALMRRNRKRGKGRLGDVPTLSDALDGGRDMALAPTLILPEVEANVADGIALDALQGAPVAGAGVDSAEPMSLDTLGDVPVLTDAVLDWPPESAARSSSLRGLDSEGGDRLAVAPRQVAVTADAATADALTADALTDAAATAGDAFPASAAEAEAAAAGVAPPAVLEQEPTGAPDEAAPAGSQEALHAEAHAHAASPPRVPFLDDDFILDIPPPDENAATTAAAAPTAAAIAATALSPGSREWNALAEEIRMQVLQRLDLFTDTGLREQLGARLSPIVERASAQLIETINRELGELVRGYVAEAIEREIDSWRNQNPK